MKVVGNDKVVIGEQRNKESSHSGEIDTRRKLYIVLWNVRTMLDISKSYQIAEEMNKVKIPQFTQAIQKRTEILRGWSGMKYRKGLYR